MKRVDGTKDRFNWAENDEIYYEEEELLCHLEPPYPAPYPTYSRMTFAFFDSDIKTVMAALRK